MLYSYYHINLLTVHYISRLPPSSVVTSEIQQFSQLHNCVNKITSSRERSGTDLHVVFTVNMSSQAQQNTACMYIIQEYWISLEERLNSLQEYLYWDNLKPFLLFWSEGMYDDDASSNDSCEDILILWFVICYYWCDRHNSKWHFSCFVIYFLNVQNVFNVCLVNAVVVSGITTFYATVKNDVSISDMYNCLLVWFRKYSLHSW